jgi:hypothetical protein
LQQYRRAQSVNETVDFGGATYSYGALMVFRPDPIDAAFVRYRIPEGERRVRFPTTPGLGSSDPNQYVEMPSTGENVLLRTDAFHGTGFFGTYGSSSLVGLTSSIIDGVTAPAAGDILDRHESWAFGLGYNIGTIGVVSASASFNVEIEWAGTLTLSEVIWEIIDLTTQPLYGWGHIIAQT